jgi:hypothetical protein
MLTNTFFQANLGKIAIKAVLLLFRHLCSVLSVRVFYDAGIMAEPLHEATPFVAEKLLDFLC